MAKKKVSKHDETVDSTRLQSWCAYVKTDKKEMVVGVFNTTEDMVEANKSKLLKKLKGTFKYSIQMVIK